ncbi:MAG: thiamine pyrophosphate-dependent enzyme [Proteobacteria bacterium]|nr:thiamine pyrophosphate-dependent enzyme [Pseudomonadota bacterium]
MSKSNLMSQKLFNKEYRSSKKLLSKKTKGVTTASGETVASYLNKRLAEIGVKHVMAIPGDYIAEWVETLDTSEKAGLIRVHPNNEMLATYAADGYARASNGQSIGCVAFTYGVGALNAVQAVAVAHVENVPLVAINGSPSPAQFNSQRDMGVLWHHMFDGNYTDLRIFQEVTRMAVRIDNPAYAPDLIDAALTACITDSLPVYIEIASTMEGHNCQPVSERPQLIRAPVPQDQDDLNNAVAYVMSILKQSKNLVIMGGVEIARYNIQVKFEKLLKLIKAPYVSSLLGKGLLSEYKDDIYFSGVFNGLNSQQNVQDLIKSSDIIMGLGVKETDFNFAGLASADFDPSAPPGLPITGQIEARMGAVKINNIASKDEDGEVYWGNIELEPFIDALIDSVQKLKGSQLPNAPFTGLKGSPWDIPPASSYADKDQVTWDSFKSLLQHNYLSSFNDSDAPVLLADTGLTFYSLNNIKVPANGFIAQLAWGAIGYSPGASYGVKLALEDQGINRRVISVSGDGAFAESVNAIGTIAELGLDNVVFVMANGVFAIEQFLIDANAFCETPDAPKFTALTQVPQTSLWDWKKLAEGFGGIGYEVTTNEELNQVLKTLKDGSPKATTATGPCTEVSSSGCCDFDGNTPAKRRSTFTLVAVRNVCKDLPSNTKWKLNC